MKDFKENSNSGLFAVFVSVYVRGESIEDALDKVAEVLGNKKNKEVLLYQFDERSEELEGDFKDWVLRKAGIEL